MRSLISGLVKNRCAEDLGKVLKSSFIWVFKTMSIDEALKLIEDSKNFLEPYKMYGKMISDGIAQLDELKRFINEKAYVDAYGMSLDMCEQLAAYRNFVPKLAEN